MKPDSPRDRRIASLFLLPLLALALAACTPWGVFDSAADPESSSYQGYETVADPSEVKPAGDSGTVAYVPTLVAYKLLGAEAYQYQIASDSGFASIIYTSAATTENECVAADCPALPAGMTHYWRVRVKKSGTWSEYSAAYASFALSEMELGTVSPADAGWTYDATPLLAWGDATDAAGYEVQAGTSSTAMSSSTAVACTASEYQYPSTLAKRATVYWRVRARNGNGAWGAWSSTLSFSIAYQIGEAGPAGGIIFYDKGSFSDGWRYLEAARSDQGTVQWCNDGKCVFTGASGFDIGTGAVNTAIIVSAQGTGSYAASICANLSLGGYDDWFLPSWYEMIEMWKQRDAIGGFSKTWYWSSTEDLNYPWSVTDAFSECFVDGSNGSSSVGAKTSLYPVRAIRAF